MRLHSLALFAGIIMSTSTAMAQSYEETAMFLIYGVKSGMTVSNRVGSYTLKAERTPNTYKLEGSDGKSAIIISITGTGICSFETMYGIVPYDGDAEKNYYKYKVNLQEVESLKVVSDTTSPTGKYAIVSGTNAACTVVSTSNNIKWNEKPCPSRFTTFASQDQLDKALAYLNKQYCPKRAF